MKNVAMEGCKRMAVGMAAALTLAGCSDLSEIEKNWAKCHLESYGPIGINFQKNYVSFRKEPQVKIDDAYNAFVLMCMNSKGFEFQRPFSSEGKSTATCWARGKDFTAYSIPDSSDTQCYIKP